MKQEFVQEELLFKPLSPLRGMNINKKNFYTLKELAFYD